MAQHLESLFKPNLKFQDPDFIRKREPPVLKSDLKIVSRKVLSKPQDLLGKQVAQKILNCIVEIFMNEQHMD